MRAEGGGASVLVLVLVHGPESLKYASSFYFHADSMSRTISGFSNPNNSLVRKTLKLEP